MVIPAVPGDTGERSFDLCGGHPVLDFVNSLDNRFNGRDRVEGLQSYGDLLRFALQTRLLEPAQIGTRVAPAAGARALRAALALREALAAILYAVLDGRTPPSTDLETLERCFRAAERHRALRWLQTHEQAGLGWSWRIEGDADLPVWALARAAIELMLSPDMKRVSACESATCRWLFLDTSKSHTRRWCKMQICGNRVKARRYQARHSD